MTSVAATLCSIVAVLGVDVTLWALHLRTLSQVVHAWSMQAPVIAIAGGSLMGHFFHDAWQLHLKPVPAHAAYVAALTACGIIAQAMRDADRPLPMIVLVNVGYIMAHVTVPA